MSPGDRLMAPDGVSSYVSVDPLPSTTQRISQTGSDPLSTRSIRDRVARIAVNSAMGTGTEIEMTSLTRRANTGVRT